jgi:hypothetical protein
MEQLLVLTALSHSKSLTIPRPWLFSYLGYLAEEVSVAGSSNLTIGWCRILPPWAR